ncbi:MAG: S26 family signal peptidase [Planctomycetota bacterium]|jgi:signal peptidase I
MRQKTVLRVARLALLLGIVLAVAFFVRGNPRLTIPEHDQSMDPRFPGGSTVVVEELEADAPVPRGADVVYAMEKDGVTYARFGRVQGLAGDVIGARDGRLTVNGERVGPLSIPGAALGEVPPGKVFILALNPLEKTYPDSRVLGFIPREDLRAIIRYRIGG